MMSRLLNTLKMAGLFVSLACSLSLIPSAWAQAPAPGPQARPRPGNQMVQRPAMQWQGRRLGRQAMMRPEMIRQLLRNPEVLKRFGITDDQRKKLEDILFNTEKTGIEAQAVMQVRRLELRHLLQADNPDRGAIDKKLQEVSQAQTALVRARLNELLDARSVFSKDQLEKIREAAANLRRPMQRRTMQGQGQFPGRRREGAAPFTPAPPLPPGK